MMVGDKSCNCFCRVPFSNYLVVSPNVMAMIAHFNNVSGYIQAVVLTFPTPKERSVVVEHAIHVRKDSFSFSAIVGNLLFS